jgi:hypothetical protein
VRSTTAAPRTGAAVLISAQPDSAGVPDSSRFSRALDGRFVRRVDIVAHNVFDPLPTGPFRFLGAIANHAHIRTRTTVVRQQVLLRSGRTWTAARGRESVRLLRNLDFLDPLSIRAIPAGDSVDVRVETRDVWTTQPEVNVERGGGKVFGAFAFTERNLLGLGKSVSVGYREDPIGITRSIDLNDPGVGGTRVRFHVSGARGTSGATDLMEVVQPFYAIEAPGTFGFSALRTSGDAHLFQNNAEVAILSQHVEDVQLFAGRGWRQGNGVLRTTLSIESLERKLGATRETGAATPPESFLGPEEMLRLRLASIEFRAWEPRYVERTGVAMADRIEDYDLGPSFSLKLGVAPRLLGSTSDYGAFQARLDTGIETPFGIGMLRAGVQGRWRRSPEEVLETASGRWIWQSSPAHTFEAAVLGAAGNRPPRNYQTVVGGLNGLRAYPVHAVAGKRLVRWNVEDRHALVRDLFQFMTVGSAVFVDGARGWGSGAEGTGWFHDAGIGLRIAPPRAAIGPVIRVDVAWPISPTRDTRREPVLSIGSSQAF